MVTGDFSPASSDIDVVVMVEREPDEAAVEELRRLHEALAGSGGVADRLHCLYVPADSPSHDPDRLHTYWYGSRSPSRTSRPPSTGNCGITGGGLPAGGCSGCRTAGLTWGSPCCLASRQVCPAAN
ncbi:MAG: hypothetical protein ACRDOL_01005 [Streptosporangiaceae bacterium]